nr:nodulation protein [Melilotus officinalis]
MEKNGDQSRGFTYDVFLSFRGEDVRHNFIGYLRDALLHRGINAFFDDKNLKIGEDISPALSKAIEESKISVIVFSEDYASSRWCLGELANIMECTKRNKKQIAFPIFYHVDPSDVRHQRNSYGEAMVAHQNRFGEDSENVKTWIAALSEAADLKGHHINTGYLLLQEFIFFHTLSLIYPKIALRSLPTIEGNPKYLPVPRTACTPMIVLSRHLLLQYGLDPFEGTVAKSEEEFAFFFYFKRSSASSKFTSTILIKHKFEIDHIKEIVEKVHANITPKPLLSGDDPVGLEHHTEKVKSLLDNTDHAVCMLGICGLGGIGKTELAKSLYNKIVHQFEAASFLANVREKSKTISGLEDLQKTLLSEMFEQPETELGSTSKGIYEIKRKLWKKKVLLVLDDVDNIEQLKKLAGGSDWFGRGSRIIITTRDKGLLMGIHAIEVRKIYEMTELNYQHSLELFCRNAFGKSHPETGYEAMSSRAVGYAKGLPLALKVIGSNLATRKSIRAWEHALKDYERTPRKGIQDVLKVSYEVLEPYAKIVFLDIACFFKGERIEYVEEILDEFSAVSNIEELVNKSLLIVKHGCLDMHDLIQDMGRDIVMQEALEYPTKRSRLWFHEDVIRVLSDENFRSDVTKGIMLDPPQPLRQEDWSDTVFKRMSYLRILIVRSTTFSSEPKYLPNELRLLDWEGYPSKSLPPNFHPKKIIVFNLPKSRLTFEEPFKEFSYLTVMNFSQNESITTMPDVSKVKNLRELRLDNCKNLIMVHESVGFLEHLTHLSNVFTILEFLDLNLCVELEHFPDIVDKMNKPLKIHMINTAIEELPDSIGNLVGLVSIEMPNSWKLKSIPCSLFTLPNAVTFKFGGCSQLGESLRRFLHDIPLAANGRSTLKALHFGNSGLSDDDLKAILISFLELQELIVSDNNFVSLPVCIEESVHLTKLDVSGCNMLRKIPVCTNLRILNVYRCVMLEHISELPCTIQKVDARHCIRLNRETSDMLWDQVKNERRGIEIVMPRMQTEVPNWFDSSCKGGNPRFWVRKKFPVVALALVYQGVTGRTTNYRRLLVELHLDINGLRVLRKSYYNFRIEQNHVLVCDLRLLFSDEEWLGLDALLLEHEWNQVEVSYDAPSSVTLSDWGVFVYKRGTNMEEYVQFMCPDPKKSYARTNEVPPTDHMLEQMKLIDQLALDEMLPGMLSESKDWEGRFANKENFQELMAIVSGLSKEAQDALEGKPLDAKNSPLAWILRTINDDDNDEPTNFDHTDEMKPAIGIGEASTYGHQGSSEAQDSDVEQDEIMTGIFLNGMGAGLREAQSSFPSLDIDTIMIAAFNRGEWIKLSFPESEVEMKIYMEGIINGLLEAKLSFPTLKECEILNTVLRKEGHNMMFQTIDWTEIVVPSSGDPLLQAFMMMKQESSELESAKSKLFCKLLAEHNALRKKFEEIENEISTLNYSKESTMPDSTPLSSTKMHTNIEKEGSESVTKHGNLAAVLKGRAEELQKLYDAGIEEFQNSKEIQDLMTATYSNGMRDGLLEARAILLALEIDILTHVFEANANEISALDKDSHLPFSENQYDDFLEKLNAQFAQYNSKKDHSLDGTNDDSHAKESSTKVRADIGKESCKDVTKHEMLAAVLKERGEELTRLYDAEIEEFQNSEEVQDQMIAKYLSGLRDGVIEAQATLLSLKLTEVDITLDTPYPYGCFWSILYTCFWKCFS